MTPGRMSIVITVIEDEAGYHVNVDGPGTFRADISGGDDSSAGFPATLVDSTAEVVAERIGVWMWGRCE